MKTKLYYNPENGSYYILICNSTVIVDNGKDLISGIPISDDGDDYYLIDCDLLKPSLKRYRRRLKKTILDSSAALKGLSAFQSKNTYK